MITVGMFTSKSQEWATPKDFFKKLNNEFHFTLDPCCNNENKKCDKFYTREQDGIAQSWAGEVVFCNPPYGRELPKWVRKCYEEHKKNNITIVMLIPARTDTSYFHTYIYMRAEIRFIKGRLKFNDGKNPAPFPSMLVIYNKRELK